MNDILISQQSVEAGNNTRTDILLALSTRRKPTTNGLQGYSKQTNGSSMDENPRRAARGYAAIGLVNPKDPKNIGGVLRAAGCYGAALVVLSEPRPLKLSHLATDTQKAWKHIPTIHTVNVFDVVPHSSTIVAVELTDKASDLSTYKHPQTAYYIFGPEDGTLNNETLDKCNDIVYIPTRHCMNLAATVNVVLYDRLSKSRR